MKSNTTLPPLAISANSLRTAGFRDRVAAAAEAGFKGIGLRVGDYWAARDEGMSDQQIRNVLDDAGIDVIEVEAEWDWAGPFEGMRRAMLETLTRRLPEVLEYRCLNAFIFHAHTADDIIASYVQLCERAAQSNTLVGLEFIPYSAIPDLPATLAIIEAAACPNAGLVFDTWHYLRSGGTVEELRGLPGKSLLSIQLSDVLPTPLDEPRTEARHHRQVPGEGVADLRGTLQAIADSGAPTVPIAVEVVNDELDKRYPSFAKRANFLFEAASRVVAKVDWPRNSEAE